MPWQPKERWIIISLKLKHRIYSEASLLIFTMDSTVFLNPYVEEYLEPDSEDDFSYEEASIVCIVIV